MNGNHPEVNYLYQSDDELAVLIPTTERAIKYILATDFISGDHDELNFIQRVLTESFEEMNAQGPIVFIGGRDENEHIQVYAGHKSDFNLMNVLEGDIQYGELPLPIQQALLKAPKEILLYCMQHGMLNPVHFEKGTFTEEFLLDALKNGIIKCHGIYRDECTTEMYHAEASNMSDHDDYILPIGITKPLYEYQRTVEIGQKALKSFKLPTKKL